MASLKSADSKERVKKPVSDRGLIGRLALGTRPIDVNPLVVSTDVGKPVDAILRHLDPTAHANLFALEFLKIVQVGAHRSTHGWQPRLSPSLEARGRTVPSQGDGVT